MVRRVTTMHVVLGWRCWSPVFNGKEVLAHHSIEMHEARRADGSRFEKVESLLSSRLHVWRSVMLGSVGRATARGIKAHDRGRVTASSRWTGPRRGLCSAAKARQSVEEQRGRRANWAATTDVWATREGSSDGKPVLRADGKGKERSRGRATRGGTSKQQQQRRAEGAEERLTGAVDGGGTRGGGGWKNKKMWCSRSVRWERDAG
jgi:hypothetical protein